MRRCCRAASTRSCRASTGLQGRRHRGRRSSSSRAIASFGANTIRSIDDRRASPTTTRSRAEPDPTPDARAVLDRRGPAESASAVGRRLTPVPLARPRQPLPRIALDRLRPADARRSPTKRVKVGFSYNLSACGDTPALVEQFGPGLVGDVEKAITAFARYINDTGGHRRRNVQADRSSRTAAAAVRRSNLRRRRRRWRTRRRCSSPSPASTPSPTTSSRRRSRCGADATIPGSLRKYGPNGFQLLEPIEPTLEAWASFGKYYLGDRQHEANNAVPGPHRERRQRQLGHPAEDPHREDGALRPEVPRHRRLQGRRLDRADSRPDDRGDPLARQGLQAGVVHGRQPDRPHLLHATRQRRTRWFPKWTWTSLHGRRRTSTRRRAHGSAAVGERRRTVDPRAAGQASEGEATARRSTRSTTRATASRSPRRSSSRARRVLPTAESMRRGDRAHREARLEHAHARRGRDPQRLLLRRSRPDGVPVPADADGPFKTRGFSHWTVADWSSEAKRYEFPGFPCYWKRFRPNRRGCTDLRGSFK